MTDPLPGLVEDAASHGDPAGLTLWLCVAYGLDPYQAAREISGRSTTPPYGPLPVPIDLEETPP